MKRLKQRSEELIKVTKESNDAEDLEDSGNQKSKT